MKKFFAQLRPVERRLAVAVLVIVILILNWHYIWPHHSDWGNYRGQLVAGRQTLALYQKTITDAAKYDALVKGFENQGEFVPVADQAINFLRTIQTQSSSSGVGFMGMGHPITRTNEFFVEQSEGIEVNGNDQQLVDFLFKLGSSASMIRVLDLELQPDETKLRLNAHVELMASYQKNPSAPALPANSKTSGIATTTSSAPGIIKPKPFQPVNNPQQP